MILTREDLHRRVWARPMPKVAHDLGVTTAELQWLCKSLDVPFPYSWRKDGPLDGHARPLPRARSGRPEAVELDLPEAAPSRPPPTPDPRPDTPTDASTSRVALSPAPSRDADPRPEPADDRPEDPLDRGWSLIHHRLEEALARAGHTSQVVDGSPGFDVKGQLLSYWLREGYTRTKRPLTPDEARDPWKTAGGRDHVFEERMTGRLILAVQTKAYGRKVEWRDQARRGRLEDRIDEIVAGFEALADDTTRLDAERRAAEARGREAWARREAAERRAQAEADRWARLSRLANQHENARRVAALLKRLRAEIGPAVGGDPTLRAWFAWAEERIGAYDPVTWDMTQVMRQVDRPPRTRSLLEEDDDLDDEHDA